jgi:hypothetical protein
MLQVRAQEKYVQEHFKLVEPLLAKPREFEIFNRLKPFYKAKE